MARPIAYEGTEPYIFISYAQQDSDRVLPIISALQEQGFRVWYDTGNEADMEWLEHLAERLESCTVFLSFLSQTAADSPNCRREINFAIDERKEMLIIYLDECRLSAGMRMQLGVLQAMFFYRHSSQESFLEELCHSQILSSCCAAGVTSSRKPELEAIAALFEYTQTDDGGIEIQSPKDRIRTAVEIPWGVTSIGAEAFDHCDNLISIIIPDSVTSIGEGAFCKCENLTSITIPSGVTSIGDLTFDHCTNLTSITIPNGVTSIGVQAFYWCENLTSITIPDSVTSIGNDAFSLCENLAEFVVGTNNPNYCSINGILYSKCRKTLLAYPAGKQDMSFAIPDSVTNIGNNAFFYCANLTSITLPDSVISIGEGAFFGCSNLSNVTIPDSVTEIGGYAFEQCENLTSITIPNSVTSIGEQAFYWCCNLTSITIPDSVISIGKDAFVYCPRLTIRGKRGSAAEQYAAENKIPFIAI